MRAMAADPSHEVRRLVGREAQTAVMDVHLAALERSQGGLLLLSGEPGIGKTRLAVEALARARAGDVRTAWATAWPGDGAPALWPWLQILRQLGAAERTLEQFVPESPAASPAARFAQLQAVADVVREVASSARLLVVIDDLQWCDAASLRVLAFVAAAVRDVACLLVGTYRSDELAREHVAELSRVGTTLAVPGLAHDAASELLHAAVGADLSASTIATIVDRSAGNPLFVWEFGQLLAQSGRLDVAPAVVPHAVAAVIERRLARLPAAAVTTLQAAAVTGDPFTIEMVARVGEVGVDAAAAAVEAAAAAGLVAGADAAAGFAFRHDLVRDVVLDGIERVRRADLHLRVATALRPRIGSDSSFHAVDRRPPRPGGTGPCAEPRRGTGNRRAVGPQRRPGVRRSRPMLRTRRPLVA